MPKRLSTFQDEWLADQQFSLWLQRGPNVLLARCSLCNNTFDISNMGKSALNSHAEGKKHGDLINHMTSMSTLHFSKSPSVSSSSTSTASDIATSTVAGGLKGQPTIESVVKKANATEAEILWVQRTVLTHSSLRSCGDISKLFVHMFHDSEIATVFSMGKTKCSYFINFGIAPYFKDILVTLIKTAPYFVVSYDGSMNKIFQEEQMDVLVRFFNEASGLVETRYFDSAFLKRPNAFNLHTRLIESLEGLPLNNRLQLSMDGPSVNRDVLARHHKFRTEKEFADGTNIGSCGLHILHGAFKTGVKAYKWEVDKILKAMWRLLYESPARRDIYIKETLCEIWPLSFCGTRWIEDGPVAERVIEIWPNMVKVIKYWLSLCKSKQPQNKSFDTLVRHHTSSLIVPKLHFFRFIASLLKEFLVSFQSDNLLLPFMSSALYNIMKQILRIFVRKEVLENAATPYTLNKIDVSDKNNLVPSNDIRLDTATKAALSKSGATDGAKMQFKTDCITLLASLIAKLQERSPLKYGIVRNSECLSPVEMVRHKEPCVLKFGNLVDRFHTLKWITATEADSAKLQYEEFLISVHHEYRDTFLKFSMKDDRLDAFLGLYLHNNKKFASLWNICKIVFTLSHGQAGVERGFSVNKEILVENLKETSLISQRIVYDYMKVGQPLPLHEFSVPRGLLLSWKCAHSQYVAFLEEEKRSKQKTEIATKRKLVEEEISQIKRKKVGVEKCISSLKIDIDKYSMQAEEKQDMSLLTKFIPEIRCGKRGSPKSV